MIPLKLSKLACHLPDKEQFSKSRVAEIACGWKSSTLETETGSRHEGSASAKIQRQEGEGRG